MVTEIFVNIPVKDLQKSMGFFKALGFSFNEQFTDDKAACLVMGSNIFAMLLTEPFFKTFTNKSIADTQSQTEVINAIAVETKEKVDVIIDKAIQAGGKEPRPAEDHGWMYQRSFEDIDGHLWEVLFTDPTKIPQG